jgi:hypothetical protein
VCNWVGFTCAIGRMGRCGTRGMRASTQVRRVRESFPQLCDCSSFGPCVYRREAFVCLGPRKVAYELQSRSRTCSTQGCTRAPLKVAHVLHSRSRTCSTQGRARASLKVAHVLPQGRARAPLKVTYLAQSRARASLKVVRVLRTRSRTCFAPRFSGALLVFVESFSHHCSLNLRSLKRRDRFLAPLRWCTPPLQRRRTATALLHCSSSWPTFGRGCHRVDHNR